MTKIINFKNKICQYKYLPFLCLFILMLIQHKFMNLFGDDPYFSTATQEMGLLPYLKFRYENWTSRIVIEGIMTQLLQYNFWLWRIIDCMMMVVLAYMIARLMGVLNKAHYNWIIVFFILAYTFLDMATAGWVATAMNYIWPLSLGLVSFLLGYKLLNEEKVTWWEYIIYILVTIYATNEEQMVIIALPIYIIMTCILINKKKINVGVIIQIIISIFNLCLMLGGPGNKSRMNAEICTWFKDYRMLSFLDKVRLGVFDTTARYLIGVNLIFLILTIMIVVYIFNKYKTNFFYKFISIIPLAISICVGMFSENTSKYLENLVANLRFTEARGMIIGTNLNIYNYTTVGAYLPIVVHLMAITALIISLYLIFKNSRTTIVILLILALGLASRTAMGFSPTMYASDTRPFIFMDFALIFVGMFIYKKIVDELPKNIYINILIIMVLAAGASYLNVIVGT